MLVCKTVLTERMQDHRQCLLLRLLSWRDGVKRLLDQVSPSYGAVHTLTVTTWAVAQRFSMQKTVCKAAVNIAELQKNPSRVLADAAGASVALLDQNHVVAYLVPAELYEQILERLDDFELAALVMARAAEKSIQVSLEDL